MSKVIADYDSDILEWSERQAPLLRRLTSDEAVSDEIDWPDLIEEVEANDLSSNPGVNIPWAAQPRNLMFQTWIVL